MDYVNIHGKPISVAPVKQEKKRSSRESQQYHKGWRVVGYSPEQVRDGALAYERDGLEARTGKPFSVHEFMVTHKPRPVRSRPYELYEAAEQCRQMAERSGWIGVRLEIKAKGGGNG